MGDGKSSSLVKNGSITLRIRGNSKGIQELGYWEVA